VVRAAPPGGAARAAVELGRRARLGRFAVVTISTNSAARFDRDQGGGYQHEPERSHREVG